MNTDIFISELFFVFIAVVSAIFAYQFYILKNGVLRKLMVFYWLSNCWGAGVGSIWYFLRSKEVDVISLSYAKIIGLLPLSIAMLLFLAHIIKLNTNHGKT